MTEPTPLGRLTTFYSYAGGVGRSFLLANVAWLLARAGQRVLCLDWDLEAPGLHRYLDPQGTDTRGTLDLLLHLRDHPEGPPAPWQDWVRPLPGPWRTTGCLHLMTAGQGMGEYTRRLSGLHWDRLFAEGIADRVEAVRAELVRAYDHVLIDSRTGITDVGGICAAQLPDLLVLVFTASAQSLEGALDVAQKAQASRARLPLDRGGFDCLPVPCRVHVGEEDELERQWMRRFEERAGTLIRPWLDREVRVDELLPFLRVREQAKWSFGEQLPVKEEPENDPARVSWAIANVAALVSAGVEAAPRLLTDRRGLLRAQTRGEARPGEGAQIYLSAPPSTHPAAEAIGRALGAVGLEVCTPATLVGAASWRSNPILPGRLYPELQELQRSAQAWVVIFGDRLELNQTIDLAELPNPHSGRAVIVTTFATEAQQLPAWLQGYPTFPWSTDPAWSPKPVVDAVLAQLARA
jgi:cellulose biosynthesis protein BcsQ